MGAYSPSRLINNELQKKIINKIIKLKKLMHSPVILDTRNILNITELKELGFKFDNVGRK